MSPWSSISRKIAWIAGLLLVLITVQNVRRIASLTSANALLAAEIGNPHDVVALGLDSPAGTIPLATYGPANANNTGRHAVFVSGSDEASAEAFPRWEEMAHAMSWSPSDRVTWITTTVPQPRHTFPAAMSALAGRLQVRLVCDLETFELATGISRWPMTAIQTGRAGGVAIHFGGLTPEAATSIELVWNGDGVSRGNLRRNAFLSPFGKLDAPVQEKKEPSQPCVASHSTADGR